MSYYLGVLKKYAVFKGRARRAEYWYFVLFNFIASIILSIIDGFIMTSVEGGIGFLAAIYGLAVIIPSIAVAVRRLHDTGRSGWMLLLSFIPFIGIIWVIVLFILPSGPGSNKYGPNPIGAAPATPAVPPVTK